MRVAIVYHFFAHYRGPIIKEMLKNDEVEYTFIGGRKTNRFYKSLKLFEFNEGDRFINVTNYWINGYFLWQSNLISTLKNEKFDAVIFLGDWKFISTWASIIYLNQKKTPCLFWSHGILNPKFSINNTIKFIFLNKFRYGGFVYDNRAKKILQSKGFNRKLDVVYNSLDYNSQMAIINSLTVTDFNNITFPGNKYVIFSGRIDERKNLKLLLKAIHILKTQSTFISALIVGDGEYVKILKEYAAELDVLDQVIFYGSCYDEKMLAMFFMRAIACVVPSAVGLTAIHSLTYGVPVITNDYIYSHGPEIEAVLENVTGTFFNKDDAPSLANKIEFFMNLDYNERQFYRCNAMAIIKEKFTPENQLRIINKRLKEILI